MTIHASRRLITAVTAAAAVVLSLVLPIAVAPAASADTPAPAVSGPGPVLQIGSSNVTADALPTVQIDGVVWTQVISGNTVYAGGSFANARPAGAAAGTQLTPRTNLLAYNLSTGVLISTFVPNLNGQVKALAMSTDGSKLLVGGDFTTADGVTHNHFVALNPSTGAAISTFTPDVNATVSTIQVSGTSAFIGGNFTTASSTTRNHLAAYNTSTGALLGWRPSADANVSSMVIGPDGTKMYIGGKFANINSSAAYGLAEVDLNVGALIPWAVNNVVRDGGTQAGITSLHTDGKNIIGTGYVFGAGGNLEGTFSADPNTGAIVWMEDCHGDTYDSYSNAGVTYTVSHAHYCATVGGFPQTDANWAINQRHTLAFTDSATGTLGHNIYGGYTDWYGQPSPSLYNWFPTLITGSFTGQGQAAWDVTGNGTYVIEGGEFPNVNGTGQQGLVRFATRPTAPGKQGPLNIQTKFVPTLVPFSNSTLRVSWPANTDRDDLNLTYKVYRNGVVIKTLTDSSPYWNVATLGLMDSGLTPGATYNYQLNATDSTGNTSWGAVTSVTMPTTSTGSSNAYAQQVIADGATSYWPLDEASGTVAYDHVAYSDLDEGAGITDGTSGAITGDTAATFSGATTASAASRSPITGPDVLTVSAWIRTTTTSGGKIIGFGNAQTGSSSGYDRQVYMDNAGHLLWGVCSNVCPATAISTNSYNDGNWHQVVGTLSPAGLVLYVDGVKVAGRTDVTTGQAFTGYWRVGGDNTGGWTNRPSSDYFAGDIDEVAVFNGKALDKNAVQAEYVASGRASTLPAIPTDKYGAAVYGDSPEAYYRLDETSGPSAVDSSRNSDTGVYTANESFGTASPVSGATGSAVTFDGSTGTLASTIQETAPSVYSEEVWFKTTTTSGGKLIGFGNAQTGNSSNYDRHVWMDNSGVLNFGTYTGQLNIASSTQAYNDGNWHYVVATQSASGMKLYVDDLLVGTNAQTSAQPYTGYWRVGGDSSWSGSSSYFAGTLDEAAFYPVELSQAQVDKHWNASSAVNHAPVAAFTATPSNLTVAFDGSGSTDQDGPIASYSWDFGDGTTGTGSTVSHNYTAAGSYTVKLTVTDGGGLTNTVSQSVTAVAPNQPPVAAFTNTVNGLAVAFDGTGSSDPDGTVASYAWDFGDGSTGTGSTVSHSFSGTGSYSVKLTVTDNQGASTSVTQSVSVVKPNQPPVAAFTAAPTDLAVAFDGTGSTDPDGTVASYAWDFGDTTTGTGSTVSHTYTSAGTYTVQLTVTDNQGATNTATQSVTVLAPNQPPVAAFTNTVNGLAVAFDGTGSSDPDGTVASYAWDFGDTGTGTGSTASHTYSATGTYTVKLTVTDNRGGKNSVTQTVSVVAPNQPPVASFTANPTLLAVTFDGTGSSDPDGSIASYSWDFGDSTSSTASKPAHTYTSAGTYSVKLTVTDNQGATNTATKSVVVTQLVAADAFGRTVTNGLGNADTGGAWSLVGANSLFGVKNGVGTLAMTKAGAGASAFLNTPSTQNSDVVVDVATDKIATGGGYYASVASRHTAAGDYRLKVLVGSTGAVTLYLTKMVGTTETTLKTFVVSGLTATAGQSLRVRFDVTGNGTTSTLTGKVWSAAGTEPTAWQASVTDTTAALQGPGGFGIWTYLAGSATNATVTASFDNLTATALN